MDLDILRFGLRGDFLDLGADDFLPFSGEVDILSLGPLCFDSSKVSDGLRSVSSIETFLNLRNGSSTRLKLTTFSFILRYSSASST